MALTPPDRRRLALATALTLVALPVLWWANQDAGAPNVATAGLDAVADDGATADDASDADPAATGTGGQLVPPSTAPDGAASTPADATPVTPPATPPPATPPSTVTGGGEPVFLDGPAAQVGAGLPAIAVPPTTGDRLTMRATFRSSVGPPSTCTVPGMLNGITVTVVNLDNNRATTCVTGIAPLGATEMVVHPERFDDIADLTDAPIPVEIRR
jgi:hypothetical protein